MAHALCFGCGSDDHPPLHRAGFLAGSAEGKSTYTLSRSSRIAAFASASSTTLAINGDEFLRLWSILGFLGDAGLSSGNARIRAGANGRGAFRLMGRARSTHRAYRRALFRSLGIRSRK